MDRPGQEQTQLLASLVQLHILDELSQFCLPGLAGFLSADEFPRHAMGVTRSNILQKLHESKLIHTGLLRTYVLLPEELLPPLFALLLQVPLLKVIYQRNMVKLTRVDGRPYSVQSLPKLRVGRRTIPPHSHD